MSTQQIVQGDCLEVMKTFPDKSFDLVLTDPPYGSTACSWDTVIPFVPMWEQLKRITKENSAIILFGAQPFTSALIMSNPKMFKYEWIWEKTRGTGHLNSKHRPLLTHENICVFYEKSPTYNPQMTKGKPYDKGYTEKGSELYGQNKSYHNANLTGDRLPRTSLKFSNQRKGNVHPTQKPLALIEYLIKTYTNQGDTILDFAVGSGTTLLATKQLNRNAVGIEISDKYCKIAQERLDKSTDNLFQLSHGDNSLVT